MTDPVMNTGGQRRHHVAPRLPGVELPAIRDRLATDYEHNTMQTVDPDVRAFTVRASARAPSNFASFVACHS